MVYGNTLLFGKIVRMGELATTEKGTAAITFYVTEEDKTMLANRPWHQVKAYGEIAEILHRSYKVDDEIFITGFLKYSNHEIDGRKVKQAYIEAMNLKYMSKLELKVSWKDDETAPTISTKRK